MDNKELVTKEVYGDRVNYLEDVNAEIPQTAEFGKIKERTGPFGWFKRSVTGEEMNEHLQELQSQFAEQNRRDILTIEELQRIYNEISILDDDYIKKLVNSAEEMKKLKENVDDSLEKYSYMEKKINEVISAQGVLIDKFKAFDNAFLLEEKCKKLEQEVSILSEEKTELINKNEEIVSKVISQDSIISKLNTKIMILYIALGGVGILSVIGLVLSIIR